VTVSKLAAILRIAIALDASRSQRVRDISCVRDRSRLIITAPHVEDLSVEQLALRQGRALFEEVYGIQVLLRTQGRVDQRGSSSQL
jgi:exopolyphosphatase/guanosine-5'-triphosphate,3'-diphosphate pyrophosphatase